MAWFQSNRRVQLPAQAQAQAQAQTQTQIPPVVDDDERIANDDEDDENLKLKPTDSKVTEDQNGDPFMGVKVTEDQNRDPFMGVNVTEDQNRDPFMGVKVTEDQNRDPFMGVKVTEDQNRDPFMGVKVRRKASFHRDYIGDYLDVPSRPYLMKILEKQGDKKVLFADKVLKFTSTGKMKRRILLITDFAVYIVDPDIDALKRRISLAAVEKLCLSERSDNFLAIIIPTEYDLLIASTRKTEIVTVIVDTTRSQSDYELEVLLSNRFEYNATSELVKEIDFEETEGGVRTRIVRK